MYPILNMLGAFCLLTSLPYADRHEPVDAFLEFIYYPSLVLMHMPLRATYKEGLIRIWCKLFFGCLGGVFL